MQLSRRAATAIVLVAAAGIPGAMLLLPFAPEPEQGALGWLIVILPLVAQLVMSKMLADSLRSKVLEGGAALLEACIRFCLAMAFVPVLVVAFTGGMGLYLYSYYPSLRPQSWDVALLTTSLLLLLFSWVVAFIFALVVLAKLLLARLARRNAAAASSSLGAVSRQA